MKNQGLSIIQLTTFKNNILVVVVYVDTNINWYCHCFCNQPTVV